MNLALILILSCFIRTPTGRLIFYAFGAIAVLGPTNLTPAKIVYVVIIILCRIIAIKKVSRDGLEEEYRKVLGGTPVLLLTLILFLLIISVFLNNDIVYILRALLPLFLFYLVLPILYQSGLDITESKFNLIVISLGNISAISVFFVWSQRHGLLDFGLERFALDADWLAFLGLIFCLNSPKSYSKIVHFYLILSAILIPSFLILSLTRSNIVFVLSIFVASFLAKPRNGKNRLLILSSMSIVSWLIYVSSKEFKSEALYRRIVGTWNALLSHGTTSAGLGSDLSIRYRRSQAELARKTFLESPLFGTGVLPPNQSFDTIWGAVLQFGIIGSIICIWLLISTLPKFGNHFMKNFSLNLSFLILMIAASFIYNWTSNKSFWIALSIYFVKVIQGKVKSSEYI